MYVVDFISKVLTTLPAYSGSYDHNGVVLGLGGEAGLQV